MVNRNYERSPNSTQNKNNICHGTNIIQEDEESLDDVCMVIAEGAWSQLQGWSVSAEEAVKT